MIKLKSIFVIILSSILISSVILLTILGLSLYVGWKEGESARLHNEKISRLNAAIYGQFINIQDIQARYHAKGIYKGKYLLEGLIKNNGYRTISSIELRVDFINKKGDTIYAENFFPLKTPALPRKKTIAALSLFTSRKEHPLLPGEAIRFNRILHEQKDKNIMSPIKYKRYATNPDEWSGKFKYEIKSIRF